MLRSTVDALRNALEDQRADGAEQLRRVQEQLDVQSRAAHAEAEASRLRAAQLGEELEEAKAALEVQHAALQQQLEAICADRERQLSAALGALREEHSVDQRKMEAALVEARRGMQELQREHAALQELADRQVQELVAAQVGQGVRLGVRLMGVETRACGTGVAGVRARCTRVAAVLMACTIDF